MWRNTHERDHRITFDPEKHIYHIDDRECFASSTGLVSMFFPKFDAAKVVDQYYDKWQRTNHPKYGGLSKEEILTSWVDEGEESSVLGTRLHEAIESFYKGEEPYIEDIEEDYALFTQFQKKYPQLIPYRIEWRVGTDPDIGVAGSIDMCFTMAGLPDDTVIIVDWKRTRKKVESVGFRGRTGLYPLNHLPDTNFYHYSIQLNIYKYILETYYNLKVRSMAFVVLNRVHSNYIVCKVDDLQYEVSLILDIVRKQRVVREKEVFESSNDKKYLYNKARPQQVISDILHQNQIGFERFSELCTESIKRLQPNMLPGHVNTLNNSILEAVRGYSRIRYNRFKFIVEDVLNKTIPNDFELINELNRKLIAKDLTSKTFGRLTVVEYVGKIASGKLGWICKCECGNEVVVINESLISGNTKSCGCYRKDLTTIYNKQAKTVHGKGNVPEFKAWYHLIQRCTNKNNKSYHNYGGRGITVSDSWLESYEHFLEDMGPRPEGTSLDRIDNDGPYCKENCRWATKHEQEDNKRRTLRFNDGTPVAKFVRDNNLNYGQVVYYYKLKYSQEDILQKLSRNVNKG